MKKILPTVALLLFLGHGAAFAEPQIYVTDDYTITLRTGPSLKNKVIADIKNDTKLEKLKDEGDWLYVRTPDGKTGYVMRRYVTSKTPVSVQFDEFKAKNQEMIEKSKQIESIVAKYEDEKRALQQNLIQAQNEREAVGKDYEDLKMGAADIVGLQTKYTQASAELKNTNALLETTKTENENLKNMRDLKWFLSGAGVLFAGWLFGFVTGSINKKRKTSRLYL